jgi:hypothetical protein
VPCVKAGKKCEGKTFPQSQWRKHQHLKLLKQHARLQDQGTLEKAADQLHAQDPVQNAPESPRAKSRVPQSPHLPTDTLTIMNNLASTCWDEAKMEEEVLKKRRRILGEEHHDTLKTMSTREGCEPIVPFGATAKKMLIRTRLKSVEGALPHSIPRTRLT